MWRVLLLPLIPVLLLIEVGTWIVTGRKPWREPGRPTCGTMIFGHLGFDVSEYE